MSLPTPPGTSHRGKENRRHTFSEPGPSRVAWAENHKFYTVSETPAWRPPLIKSASKEAPKSILKKTSYGDLPPYEPERESTPEPNDPLADLNYLANPVATIVTAESTLRELIEAYNVLAVRLRTCVTGMTDADASWPLFQPLRKNQEAVVQSMVRDLGRALEDPMATVLAPEPDAESSSMAIDPRILATGLPSPKQSPKKKRGMSAEQVKHARDLCTICHSVLKLLSAVFTLPPIYGVFTNEQLGFLLTHVLAIPLANELPTPNARKTCALAIWLIQTQRLPAEVLAPAKDRVAYALQRGIEGELGKEGKKGSANDGLKAIHDLSILYPTLFVPAFTNLLPSVFSNLLAPTVVLRSQACHALGGFAYALSSLPASAVHTHVAYITADYLLGAPLGTPPKKPESPTKDPAIIRTLRTTLGATEPKCAAQGPVWGLSVLANFVVMLGPVVYLEERVTKCLTALFSLAMRHPKSSVRGLGCLVWRAMIWAYFRPRLVKVPDSGSEEEENDPDGLDLTPTEWQEEEAQIYRERWEDTWRIVESVVDVGAGVATIGALLANANETFDDTELIVRRVFSILKSMGKKGGLTTQDAWEVLGRLVNRSADVEWDLHRLLPYGLFSANPGLLTADYKQLAQAVRPVLEECTGVEDVRCLTREELTLDWVFGAVMELWKEALVPLKLAWGTEFPPEILATWSGLIKANVSAMKDAHDVEGIIVLADYIADILSAVLRSKKLDLALKVADDAELLVPTSPLKPEGDASPSQAVDTLAPNRWRPALKLLLVRELWDTVQRTFPALALVDAGQKVLDVLIDRQVDLIVDIDVADEVRAQWALLCAEVAYHCQKEKALVIFWGAESMAKDWPECVRSFVWSHFVMKWRDENSAGWESAITLLAVPFTDRNSWDMTTDDLNEWDSFLRLTMDRALDEGIDSIAIVDRVASAISEQHSPTSLSSTRVADLLLSHLDIARARTSPRDLFEFINDTLVSTYPPEPRNKVPSIWLLRTLTRTMDTCPTELLEDMLRMVQGGISLWVSDEYSSLDRREYDLDLLPMYETIMAGMMSFTPGIRTLQKYSTVLESAFCGREDKPSGLKEAFLEFWTSTYADIPEPSTGWPEQIVTCLLAVGLQTEPVTDVAQDITDSEELDDQEVEAQLMDVPSSDDYQLSPEIPSPRSLALYNPFAPHAYRSPLPAPLSPEIPFPELPSTPKSSPHVITPHRPHKSSSPSRIAFSLLSPPTSPPSTPVRPPVTPKRRTPGFSRSHSSSRRGDKENASPLRDIASVAERIAMRSPAVSTAPVLGKRSLDVYDDGGLEVREGKRSRKDMADAFGEAFGQDSPSSSPERRDRAVLVNMFLASAAAPAQASPLKHAVYLPVPGSPSPAPPANQPRSRKRKGRFMEAVELPTLRSVRRRTSMEQVSASEDDDTDYRPMRPLPVASSSFTDGKRRVSSPKRRLRKARSASKLPSSDDEYEGPQSLPQRRTVSMPHRRRQEQESDSEADDFESEEESSSYSSPLRRLREMEPMNSDDSFILATPSLTHATSGSLCDSDLPSSDDDWNRFAGQVTPRRLVSPTVRRGQLSDTFESGEAGSDDSNMSASPTREHVARMSSVKGKGKGVALDQIVEATTLKIPSLFDLGERSYRL